MNRFSFKRALPTATDALPGRDDAMPVEGVHFVNGNAIVPPFPAHLQCAIFAMGCFWGAERLFWERAGVYSTAVGYSGGVTPNPTYDEVCSGLTGHTEAVLVIFDPATITYGELLALFWESHDPTQGFRQGNDVGTQYRSAIYPLDDSQMNEALATRDAFQQGLRSSGYGEITTEVAPAGEFYYAETYHQQYLAKNPAGYCGLAGTGVCLASMKP